MNNNRQKATHPEKTNAKNTPRLQPLKLEQLFGVAGGPIVRTDSGSPPPDK